VRTVLQEIAARRRKASASRRTIEDMAFSGAVLADDSTADRRACPVNCPRSRSRGAWGMIWVESFVRTCSVDE